LIAVLSTVWVLLGIWWGRKSKNLDGFMLAGRNVGLALGTATAMATWITSNTTMLAPQFAMELGIWGMLAYSTGAFGLLLFAPMARRIRAVMPSGYTSGDFMRLRFGKGPWLCFLIISIFYSLTWLVSMGMAGGILLNTLTGIPYGLGMSAILLTCVLYTLFGGMYAVIGTDFIQSLIILIGVVVVGYFVFQAVPFEAVYQNIATERPGLLNILLPAALMAIFNNLLFGIGEVFHSNVWWSRAFAMGKGIGHKAYMWAALFWLPVPVAAGFIALASGALGLNIPSPDMVGPLVTAHLLGYAGALLVFAVIYCSLASSIDSLLAATSDLLTQDVYGKLLRPQAKPETLRNVSAMIILGLGALTWAICLPRIGTLATVLFFAGPLVGSTIWPILTGLFWKNTNPTGVLWAMILGSALGLLAYYQLGWYTAALIGAAVSMGTVLITTRLAPREFDWSRLNESTAHNTTEVRPAS
jgi:Na+/proline symporter